MSGAVANTDTAAAAGMVVLTGAGGCGPRLELNAPLITRPKTKKANATARTTTTAYRASIAIRRSSVPGRRLRRADSDGDIIQRRVKRPAPRPVAARRWARRSGADQIHSG